MTSGGDVGTAKALVGYCNDIRGYFDHRHSRIALAFFVPSCKAAWISLLLPTSGKSPNRRDRQTNEEIQTRTIQVANSM